MAKKMKIKVILIPKINAQQLPKEIIFQILFENERYINLKKVI